MVTQLELWLDLISGFRKWYPKCSLSWRYLMKLDIFQFCQFVSVWACWANENVIHKPSNHCLSILNFIISYISMSGWWVLLSAPAPWKQIVLDFCMRLCVDYVTLICKCEGYFRLCLACMHTSSDTPPNCFLLRSPHRVAQRWSYIC